MKRKHRKFSVPVIQIVILMAGLLAGILAVSQPTRWFNRAASPSLPAPSGSPWGNEALIKNTPNNFNEIKSYLVLPRSPSSIINLNNEFTIEFWFKLNDISFSRQNLLQTAGGRLNISTFNSRGFTSILVGVSDGQNSDVFYLTGGVIFAGQWNHLAFSYIPAYWGGSFTNYLNGQSTWMDYQQYGKQLPFSDDASDIIISGHTISGFEIVNGSIEELRISNIARYPYTTGPGSYKVPDQPLKPDVNTVALWHFDGPNMCNVLTRECYTPDSSGKGNNGKIVGNVQFVSSTLPYNLPGHTTVTYRCANVDPYITPEQKITSSCQGDDSLRKLAQKACERDYSQCLNYPGTCPMSYSFSNACSYLPPTPTPTPTPKPGYRSATYRCIDKFGYQTSQKTLASSTCKTANELRNEVKTICLSDEALCRQYGSQFPDQCPASFNVFNTCAL